MWSNDQTYHHARGFLTPQATWKSARQSEYPSRPHSEGNKKGDLFHVIHKVPSGDSPYVRAKHVQLIEKDPSKAISLFWAAINAGDRVDSALKDMAAVMKQLNRSDEAIEAIKSFRHLCPCDSQESIDNVLVELYKRSGRIEEEIELLEHKLKTIEEILASGGRRTKNARSQGKKIQITMEQERSRILGNLAWAYLQLDKYEIAEQHYRKALFLEPDKNKQCNLAICLMKMNRVAEAKSLIQSVKAASGNRPMDESYAKSYERAFQMLTELLSQSALKPIAKDEDNHNNMQRPFLTPFNKILREVSSPTNGGQDFALYTQPRLLRNSTQLKDKTSLQFLSRPMVNGDRKSSWRHDESAQVKEEAAGVKSDMQNFVYRNWERESWRNGNLRRSEITESWRTPINLVDNLESTKIAVEDCLTETTPSKPDSLDPKKSWADIAEEEEQEASECFDEEGFNDENFNCNLSSWPHNQVQTISQRPGLFDPKDDQGSVGSSGNRSVRRSLCFEQQQKEENERYSMSGNIKRRNRLQVFRDITPFPDSP